MTRKTDSVDWRERVSYISKKTLPGVLFQGQEGARVTQTLLGRVLNQGSLSKGTVKVIKNKESLRSGHNQEEPKEK